MDEDRSAGLSYEEFKSGLGKCGVTLDEPALQALFRRFDDDCSGFVSYGEFLGGVRPPMSEGRLALVAEAFEAMDVNGDGALTVQDVSGRYDASLHPDVVAGTHTEVEVIQNFLAGFDGTLGPKSAIVTPEKFAAYYANVSASVDDDDYFELIVRNTWHMAAPTGAGGAPPAARRLLVTHEDGTQTVETVEEDDDVSKEDLLAIKEQLREQGIPVMKVSLYGYVDATGDGDGDKILTSSTSPKKASQPVRQPLPPPPQDEEPEVAAQAYKARMAQSNVSFA